MTNRRFTVLDHIESDAFVPLSREANAEKKEILQQPIEMIDLEKLKGIDALVTAYGKASIQARNIGECAQVYEQMLTDTDRPTILLGLAGPLIAAGLRKVIRDMIVNRMVDVIVSTGAILYQDLYQAVGFRHAVGSPDADDKKLRDLYIDRIYDTFVDEERFWRLDCSVGHFADHLPPGNYSSRQFLYELGMSLDDDQSILACAARAGVPIFSPAINDSSIGIGLTEHYHDCFTNGRPSVVIDSIRDNYELTQIVVKSPCSAAFYVAGGVPKNYINDSVVMSYIFGTDTGGHRYALQLTTDVPHWGGLSGSTLSEATSWGKISKKATHSMAFVEPSVSFPLVVGSALNKGVAKNRSKLVLEWDSPKLTKLTPKA
ncbi:MAG: deoxyhypusine synthase family protein [Deltaproteobacteria bacterium]|nr:deoxyhypusine synthase family protein [Deltaproteobacteria bacterium]